jgi:aminopeptidase N
VQQIATRAADTVKFLSSELEPFPYSNLEITQLPGLESQSWPGLVYLSSMAFLDADERRAAGVKDPYTEFLLDHLMLAHETGHQWWGDAVDWVSYRDEWIIEALANYCALLMLEKEEPKSTRIALTYYRGQLLQQTDHGIIGDAGPVTLGNRLTSSKFPNAYDRVLYGRGTWLIHMLREMLREANGRKGDAEFFAALKGLLAQSPNHKISTRDLQSAFEKVMPASLTYEGKKSLDWFFDSWVNGASIPQFNLEDVKMAPAGEKVRVTGTIKQSHTGKDTVTAIPIFAVNAKGASHFLAFVFADEPETAFKLTAPAGTTKILLDPEEMILRR